MTFLKNEPNMHRHQADPVKKEPPQKAGQQECDLFDAMMNNDWGSSDADHQNQGLSSWLCEKCSRKHAKPFKGMACLCGHIYCGK